MANFFSRLLFGLFFYGIGLFFAGIAVPAAVLLAVVQAKFDLKKVFFKKRNDMLPKGVRMLLNNFIWLVTCLFLIYTHQ